MKRSRHLANRLHDPEIAAASENDLGNLYAATNRPTEAASAYTEAIRNAESARDEPLAATANGPSAIEEIFADSSRDRMTAARKTLAYLQAGNDPTLLIDAARRLVFMKGDDPHDYKFSSAALEDYFNSSPTSRARFLASSVLLLPKSADKDNSLVQRTRSALSA